MHKCPECQSAFFDSDSECNVCGFSLTLELADGVLATSVAAGIAQAVSESRQLSHRLDVFVTKAREKFQSFERLRATLGTLPSKKQRSVALLAGLEGGLSGKSVEAFEWFSFLISQPSAGWLEYYGFSRASLVEGLRLSRRDLLELAYAASERSISQKPENSNLQIRHVQIAFLLDSLDQIEKVEDGDAIRRLLESEAGLPFSTDIPDMLMSAQTNENKSVGKLAGLGLAAMVGFAISEMA